MSNSAIRAIRIMRILREVDSMSGDELQFEIRKQVYIGTGQLGSYDEFNIVYPLIEAGWVKARLKDESDPIKDQEGKPLYDANGKPIFRYLSAQTVKTRLRNLGPKNLIFSINENAMPLLRTIGIETLTEIEQYTSDDAIRVIPLYKRPKDTTYLKRQVFVMMPFNPDLKLVYTDAILAAGKALELTVGRADDFFTNRSVMSDVWAAIYSADIIVADCTRRNTNVFYELGIAHTLGKYTVIIAQSTDDIPFDIQGFRYIIYENTEEGRDELAQKLQFAFQQFKVGITR